jgi:multiple sugar transport system substrate-binding protein
MKKKLHIIASALTLMVLVLTACAPTVTQTPTEAVIATEAPTKAPTKAPTETSPALVTITFWHIYSEAEMNKLEQTLIPQFETQYPNVTVQDVQVPYADFRRKLLTAIAGGTAPDLIRSDIIWVPEFADMGALAKLDEVMSDFSQYSSAVFEGPLSTNYYNGNYYGLPLDTNNRVLISNTAMLTAAGVEVPPTTMDEFLAACQKIHALGEGKYCFGDNSTSAWNLNPWIWSFGGNITDPNYTVSTGYLNGPQTKTAYEFWKMLLDKGYMDPCILGGGSGCDIWGGFGNDNVAMMLEGPWFPTIFGTDKEYGLTLMPAGPGGPVSVIGGEDIVLFQQSQHKAEAANFIRFMLSEDSQVAMASVGQMPVLKSLAEPGSPIDLDFYGIFLEQAKTARARTPVPNFTKIEAVYQNAGLAFLRGEQTFEEAFNPAVTEIDPLLVIP